METAYRVLYQYNTTWYGVDRLRVGTDPIQTFKCCFLCFLLFFLFSALFCYVMHFFSVLIHVNNELFCCCVCFLSCCIFCHTIIPSNFQIAEPVSVFPYPYQTHTRTCVTQVNMINSTNFSIRSAFSRNLLLILILAFTNPVAK